jgi:GH24 family phage-related lysozyme (muramidase)
MAGTLTPEAGQASFAQPVADNSLGQALTGLGNTLFSGRSSSNTPTEGAKNRELSKVLARDIRRAGGNPDKESIVIRNYLQYGGDLDANTKALLESQTGKPYGNIGVTPEQVAQKAVEESYAYNRKTEAYSTAILAGYYTLPANATNADRDQNALAYVAKQAAYNATWAAAGQELTPSLASAASAKLTDQVSAWTGALILKENSGQQVVKEDLIGARAQLDNFRMELMAQPAFMNASEDNKGKKALVAQMDAVGKRLTELEKLASTENLTNMRAQRYVETLKASFMADGVLNNDENLALMFYSDPKNLGQNPEIFNGVLSTISGAAAGDGTLPNPSISMDGTNIRIMGVGLPTETTLAAIKAKDPAVDTWQVVVEAATSLKNIDTTTYANDEIAKAALLAHANISAGLNHMDGFLSGPKARDTFDQNFIDNAQATFKANPTVGAGLSQQYQEGIAKLIVATDAHRKSIADDGILVVNADGSYSVNSEKLGSMGSEFVDSFNSVLVGTYGGDLKAFANGSLGDYNQATSTTKESGMVNQMQISTKNSIRKQVEVVGNINYLNKVKNGLKYEDPKAIAKDAVEAVEATKGGITVTPLPPLGSDTVGGDSVVDLIKGFEGYSDKAYWDVNAHRAGYGSDTVTLSDGSIVPVTPDTVVTKADAERDLARRAQEFSDKASSQVGREIWTSLPGNVTSALTSMTYNYGSLPDNVVSAVKSGDIEAIAKAVEARASDNKGVNSKRRNKEAAIIRGKALPPSAAPIYTSRPQPRDLSVTDNAPTSSPRPQGRPQSDPALSGVIPEEASQPPIKLSKAIKDGTQTVSDKILKLVERLALDPDKILMFASEADVDKALTEGIVKVGDIVIVDGGTRMKIGTVAARHVYDLGYD